jgi:hypothetical protein
MTDEPEKIEIQSGQLNDVQKTLVLAHLWTALRQAVVKMYELNGAQAVFDFQKTLILGAKNGDVTGLPLDQEKAVVDFTVDLFRGLVSFEGEDKGPTR